MELDYLKKCDMIAKWSILLVEGDIRFMSPKTSQSIIRKGYMT